MPYTEQLELNLGISRVPVLDPEMSDKLRENGMNAAIANADSKHNGWSEAAYLFLLASPFYEFRTEQIREYAYKRGLPNPPSEKSWGAVVRRAMREGMIIKKGMTIAQAKTVHAHPITLWKKTEKTTLIDSVIKELYNKIR
jgi:hypothetical protein